MKQEDVSKYSFSDGQIIDIEFDKDDVTVKYETWKEEIVEFRFTNCWKLENRKSINSEIEEVKVLESTNALTEIKSEILETGGSQEEANSIFHIVFISSWGEKVILSIIAEKAVISQQ